MTNFVVNICVSQCLQPVMVSIVNTMGLAMFFFYNFPSQRFDRRATYLWQSNCLIVEMTLDIWGGEWCICAANANASHISILTKQAVKLELQGRGRDHLIWRWICNLPPPPPLHLLRPPQCFCRDYRIYIFQ